MNEIYHPGGKREIPRTDPGWQTQQARRDENELLLKLTKGETVSFTLILALSGSGTATITLQAPTASNGGFRVEGLNAAGDFEVQMFGADDFNSPVTVQAGIAGTLEGYHVVVIEGTIGAGASGVLRPSVSGATVNPGSILHARSLHDARRYGVSA